MIRLRAAFSLLLPFVVPVSLLAGCAPAAPPVVPQSSHASPAAATAPIVVQTIGTRPEDFALVQDDRTITDAQFSELYRDELHSNDVEAALKKRLTKRTLEAVAIGTGLVLLAAGDLALAGSDWSKCKALCLKGVGASLLMGAAGVYSVGSVIANPKRYLTDGRTGPIKGLGLTREEAERFVARYDAAHAK